MYRYVDVQSTSLHMMMWTNQDDEQPTLASTQLWPVNLNSSTLRLVNLWLVVTQGVGVDVRVRSTKISWFYESLHGDCTMYNEECHGFYSICCDQCFHYIHVLQIMKSIGLCYIYKSLGQSSYDNSGWKTVNRMVPTHQLLVFIFQTIEPPFSHLPKLQIS